MKKNKIKFFLIILDVIIVFYIGASFNFFPFPLEVDCKLAVGAIGFCTLIICALISGCTYLILSAIENKDKNNKNN
ncbi:hypothetical protein C3V36_04640 [Lachnospiraceae bacterium oral taxon 500]|nr:hypothetical protein C3V36_04640 [Lachnospiraceae bacterium oral taxon 500]